MRHTSRAHLREAGRTLATLARRATSVRRPFDLEDVLGDFPAARLVERVRRSEEGADLLAERPLVDDEFCAIAELLRLPRGTFGNEYARWMIENGLHRHAEARVDAVSDPDQRYLLRRLVDVHDFWHVLSGYNCDPAGELGMLAFTFGQIPQRGIGRLLVEAVREDLRRTWRQERRIRSPLVPYLWRAFLHGRRARFLLPLQVEELFYLPIGSVRQRLGIVPAERPLSRLAMPPVAVPV